MKLLSYKNTRALLCGILVSLCAGNLFAQSDEDLFGSDDDLFFQDDDIIEFEEVAAPKTDLKNGVLFENGSVKIGGAFDLSLTSITAFSKEKSFTDSLNDSLILPTANATITIDARPNDVVRMYMKTGISYPYVTSKNSSLYGMNYAGANLVMTNDSSVRNMFYIKELFSDFNLGASVAMRFGKQTVTWGCGYFFSPADVINLTQIDPENPSNQVEGPLCLRTQIVFPGTQNALWAYIIPDSNLILGQTTYAKDTALAAKGEFVFGGWELGLGGWYKKDYAPRLMTTLTGTLFRKLGVFAEGVIGFGQDSQWKNDLDKTVFAQATAGVMYTWTTPKISLIGQYYYNGSDTNTNTKGHSGAVCLNFGKLGTSDLSATLLALSYISQENLVSSAMLTYTPFKAFSISAGPYLTWTGWDNNPVISAKLTFSLGGGKF